MKNLSYLAELLKNLPTQQQLTREKLKRKFRNSYFEYFKYFWDVVEGRELGLNWHIEYICNAVQTIFGWSANFYSQPEDAYDLIINVPPGTSKSSIISKIGPSYIWTLNPAIRIISGSYTAKPVKEFTDSFMNIIKSDKFRELDPVEFKVENIEKQSNTQGGKRYTASTGGSITGMHADIILYDDPTRPPSVKLDEFGQPQLELGATITEILAANEWHDNVLVSRKTDKWRSRAVYVQQRVDDIDMTQFILNKATMNHGQNIRHINLPSEVDVKNPDIQAWDRIYIDGKLKSEIDLRKFYKKGLLDPLRMNRKVIEREKSIRGSHIYTSQFLQDPNRSGRGRISPDWFDVVDSSEIPDNLVRYFYVDPSEGKKTSDDMAAISWSIWNKNIVIWEIIGVKKTFNEFVGYRDYTGQYIPKTYDQFVERNEANWQSIHIFEAKSSGSAFIQYLQTNTAYNIKEDIPKQSKADRVEVTKPVMETGRVKLVKHGKNIPKWIDLFLNQCKRFTGEDGGKDDMVDVLTGAIRRTDFSVDTVYKFDQPKFDDTEYTI